MKLSEVAKKFIEKEVRYGCLNYDPMKVVISRGEGPFLFDVDGKKYFDCLSAYSAVNQGHCHPRIQAAMAKQMQKLTLTSRAFYNDQLGPFEELLSQTFKYDKALLMNSGVEAGESAVKLARRWGIQVKKVPKPTVLFARGNFWGRSIAACASSDDPLRFTDFGPFDGLNFKLVDYDSLDSLAQALKDPSVAAFMVEPIQGEKGVVIPGEGYLRGCKRLLEESRALLICDEVQTGLGRTGKLACLEHFGVRPDIITLGKALSGGFYPVSAVLADQPLMDLIRPGEHGSTFGGNPLAAAVASEALRVLLDEGLIPNSERQGKLLLQELRQVFPKSVEVRGMGLFVGIQVQQGNAYTFCEELIAHGVLAKPTQQNIVRLAPVLTITDQQRTDIVDRISQAIKASKSGI